jgi:hypothetical protein
MLAGFELKVPAFADSKQFDRAAAIPQMLE